MVCNNGMATTTQQQRIRRACCYTRQENGTPTGRGSIFYVYVCVALYVFMYLCAPGVMCSGCNDGGHHDTTACSG